MKPLILAALALSLAACDSLPKPPYRSFCTYEKGMQVIPQPNGDVQLTGAITCRDDTSPFAGLPVGGKVIFSDGMHIDTEPDEFYLSVVCSMPGMHGPICNTQPRSAGY